MSQNHDAGVTALDLGVAEPLSERTKAYFAKCEEKLGLVPNVLLAYAFDEKKLDAFGNFYNDLMLAESELSKLDREIIAVVVSAINHCHYCLTAHGAAVRQLSGDPAFGEQIAQNWRAAGLDAKRIAMLDFVTKLTERPDTIVEADRQALRDAGFSNRGIFDIAAVAAFFAMSNRVASATDMKPNAEYHGMSR
ncbi:peroxidase-related enzyme [Aurantimonas sp. VKM B-3413]|uniref:peroxidase-related enzyme n=1 Tax=Aurantimonas sp. VKM B-3413 TaxID=2779401 RepID=UPI001E557720|nr:peroxidase-related enzyme [Aurantimonas sp. VKM B-3413]MCB8840668.1 peroxidase-related enzyme [Aurantimonas sp. VKM B-3413]